MDTKNFLLYRSLKDAHSHLIGYRSSEGTTFYDKQEDTVEPIPYSLNSHGYRSSEFNKDNDILILGCSQTYGKGMHNEFTWPEIFCNSIDKTYSRVAFPGDSIGGQVYKAFKYFEEIGNPKIVLGLFPLYRLEYVSVPEKFIAVLRSGNKQYEQMMPGIAYFEDQYFLKMSKAPHDPEHIVPKEFAIFYNFIFIKMLEQYCESNNIKLIWSIYDNEEISNGIEEEYKISKNYLNTSDMFKNMRCQSNNLKHCSREFVNHKLYDLAADSGHWGIHMHRHFAEKFIEKYKEVEND